MNKMAEPDTKRLAGVDSGNKFDPLNVASDMIMDHPPCSDQTVKEHSLFCMEGVVVSFESLDNKGLVSAIVLHHQTASDMASIAQKAVTESLSNVIKAGLGLLEAKRRVQHGDWGVWLQKNLPGIPRSRICRYMKLAEQISHVRNLDALKSVRQAYVATGIIKGAEKSPQLVKTRKSSEFGSIEGMLTQAQETRKAMRLFLTKNKAENLSMETKSQLRMELRELVEILRLLTDSGTSDLPEETPDQSDA